MTYNTYLIRAVAIALCVLSQDVNAWGLGTHVYFAESLITVPLAIPALLVAMRRFPAWVLAGACLPDLALFGDLCGTNAFANNHRWATAQRLLHSAKCDEEKAAAIGYFSHLFVDVIAHNHFVPTHEQRWINIPNVTHAVAEWAMDVHLRSHIKVWPAELLGAQHMALVEYVADNFGCSRRSAQRTLKALARAETLLRASHLPEACYFFARSLDTRVPDRFDEYVSITAQALPQIGHAFGGIEPSWHPEGVEHPIPSLQEFALLVHSG